MLAPPPWPICLPAEGLMKAQGHLVQMANIHQRSNMSNGEGRGESSAGRKQGYGLGQARFKPDKQFSSGDIWMVEVTFCVVAGRCQCCRCNSETEHSTETMTSLNHKISHHHNLAVPRCHKKIKGRIRARLAGFHF